MGCNVFANGNEIACKAGDGKVICGFPDVCLTPPPPPAGPIPVPYPDTSFSRDMLNGTKAVMIMGLEVMMRDLSFYMTMPLGDEPATWGQGAGVITHMISGKTYFTSWSMDVMFEGMNVDRHIDVCTSNHGSPPPNEGVPMPNIASMFMSLFSPPPPPDPMQQQMEEDNKNSQQDQWKTMSDEQTKIFEVQQQVDTDRGKEQRALDKMSYEMIHGPRE
jgi:hypothetical protein